MELILLIGWGIVWGAFADSVASKKGRQAFWWGFWLGPIGLIVALTMAPATTHICSHCGGGITPGFSRCKNCGGTLVENAKLNVAAVQSVWTRPILGGGPKSKVGL